MSGASRQAKWRSARLTKEMKKEQNARYQINRRAKMASDPGYAEKRRAQSRVCQNARHRKLLEEKAGRPRPDACEICGEPDAAGRELAFDHDHATGAFRGWLCGHCNTGIGLFKDNPSLLAKAIEYLAASRGGQNRVMGCINPHTAILNRAQVARS